MRRAALPPDHPTHFLRGDTLVAGLSRHDFAGLLERGELHRLAPGAYAADADADADARGWVEDHVATVRLAARLDPHAVVSHVSAALLWGLPHPISRPGRVTLTVTGLPRTSRDESWVRLHRAAIPHRHRRDRGGLQVTSPARTVLDCLRSMRGGDALAIADAAVRRGFTGVLELEDAHDIMRRWPGIDGARTNLGLLDPQRENWFESWSAWSLTVQELPVATSQVDVFSLKGRFVARVDFLWEEAGMVGEADGAGKYLGEFDHRGSGPGEIAQRLIESAARESALRSLGLGVGRWSPSEILRDSGIVAARLRAESARTDPRGIRCLIRRPGETRPTLYSPDRVRPL